MKGLSTSLVIVVTAIVILVVALVILTIFGTGITRFNTIAEARNFCYGIGVPSCETTGTLPAGWSRNTYETPQGIQTCAQLVGDNCEQVLINAG
jgi:hypothetical protein